MHPSLCQVPMESQLDGLVGVVGERRTVNVHLQVVCLELMTHRSRANHCTIATRPHTIYIIMHIYMYVYIIYIMYFGSVTFSIQQS